MNTLLTGFEHTTFDPTYSPLLDVSHPPQYHHCVSCFNVFLRSFRQQNQNNIYDTAHLLRNLSQSAHTTFLETQSTASFFCLQINQIDVKVISTSKLSDSAWEHISRIELHRIEAMCHTLWTYDKEARTRSISFNCFIIN